MYKLVIVEDESDVRHHLIDLVKKADSKFQLVAEYENGVDAYEGIPQDMPDLMITDIRIPYIDGIELAKRIKELLPLIRIIIITGYNEFDYAKEAANLGVVGFLSKPITVGDISQLLDKASDLLDEEYLTNANVKQLESFYETHLPVVREAELYRLSHMSEVPDDYGERLAYNKINLAYRYFCICVFDHDESRTSDIQRYEQTFSIVRNLCRDSFSNLCEIDLFNRSETLCLILKSDSGFLIPDIETRIERIILRVERFSGISVSAGISKIYEDERNFSGMMGEAMHALSFRGVMGGGKVFLSDSDFTVSSIHAIAADNEFKELAYLLRYHSAEECLARMQFLRGKISGSENQGAYDYVITGILNTLIMACDNQDILYSRYQDSGSLHHRLLNYKIADEAFTFLSELIYDIRGLNEESLVGAVEQNLQRVLAYIDTHYCDADISFENTARNVNFSVSYIAALLKKKLNTSFVKYLTSLRMEKAKELLFDPRLKITDISEQLGYADPYYFSHCFKKYTGMTPKEYRNHE